jgi:hypothetical protein
MAGGLGLGGRDVLDRLEKAAIVEPVDPFGGSALDRFEAAPGPPRGPRRWITSAL